MQTLLLLIVTHAGAVGLGIVAGYVWRGEITKKLGHGG